MTTNFPGSLDSFTTRVNGQNIDASHINDLQDAVAAVQAKVGADGSATATSLEHRIAQAHAGEAAHFGFKAWNWDLMDTGNAAATPTSGTLQLVRLVVPRATITNVHLAVATAGSPTGLYAALYTSAGALLSQSGSIHSGLTTGVKTFALGAAQAVEAGPVYVAWWFTGTSTQFHQNQRPFNNSDFRHNGGLAAPNLRFAVADTGLTTTAPATLGTMTGTGSGAWWVAVS